MIYRIQIALCSLLMSGVLGACSSTSERGASDDHRRPSGYSRAGREYREPRPMNHRRVDTDALFEACLREWPELYCRNRMGR